jgi:HD-like signal output (HDOD) protein
MIILLTISFLIFVVLILYLLVNKQKPPAQCRKNKHRVKNKLLPEPDKAVSSLHKEQHDVMGVCRESIKRGIKSIFSGAQFEFSNEPMPLKRTDVPQELYRRVKDCVGDMREFSSVYKISNLLDDPQVDLSKVAKMISTDPILSNKILRTANSAFFGSSRAVDSINHALALLGFVNIKSILFHNVLSKKFSTATSVNPAIMALLDHSIKAALCGVYISDAFEGLHKGKIYTLGLMHDVGKFVLPELAHEGTFDPNVIIPYGEKVSILREDALFGINHAVIGRIALEDSGISDQLLNVIEFHHYPLFTHKSFHLSREEDQRYLTALYLANQIAKLFAKDTEKSIFAVQPLPPSYQGFINQSKLEMIFNDERVLADIFRSGDLTP